MKEFNTNYKAEAAAIDIALDLSESQTIIFKVKYVETPDKLIIGADLGYKAYGYTIPNFSKWASKYSAAEIADKIRLRLIDDIKRDWHKREI